MRHSIILLISLAGSLPLSLACGSDAPPPGSGDGGPKATGPILPWNVGNRWTYRVTDSAGVTTKETTIEEEETVGGTGPNADKRAYRVVTKKQDGADQTISWQVDEGDTVIRYREQAFSASTDELEQEEYWEPSKLHVDGTEEHTTAGARWLLTYKEFKIDIGPPTGGAAATGGAGGGPSTGGAPASGGTSGSGGTVTEAEARDLWSVDGVGEQVTVPYGTFGDCIIFQKVGGSQPKTYWYVRGVGKVKETGSQTEELVSYELVQ